MITWNDTLTNVWNSPVRERLCTESFISERCNGFESYVSDKKNGCSVEVG